MENVFRVKYLEELNQLWLIGSNVLDHWVKSKRSYDNEEIKDKIYKYILRVDSESERLVTLGGCFTNLNRFYSRSYGSNLMIFPLREEKVSYSFKRDFPGFISNSDDPAVICPSSNLYPVPGRAILFFKENPFKHDKYKKLEISIFQDESDRRCIHSKTRKKLAKKAGSLKLGSLDSFI